MGGDGEKHKEINKWAKARTNYRLREIREGQREVASDLIKLCVMK